MMEFVFFYIFQLIYERRGADSYKVGYFFARKRVM